MGVQKAIKIPGTTIIINVCGFRGLGMYRKFDIACMHENLSKRENLYPRNIPAIWYYDIGSKLASILAPLTRGPGNHRLRVGRFNSKFVSKTLCNLSINLLYYGHPRG